VTTTLYHILTKLQSSDDHSLSHPYQVTIQWRPLSITSFPSYNPVTTTLYHFLPKLQSSVILSLDNIHSRLQTALLHKPEISDLCDTLHSSLKDCLKLTCVALLACDLHNNFSGTLSAWCHPCVWAETCCRFITQNIKIVLLIKPTICTNFSNLFLE